MIDLLLPAIEAVQSEGAIVLLKWDGERVSSRSTVVIIRKDTDFVWRQDSDNIVASLKLALQEYRSNHPLCDK